MFENLVNYERFKTSKRVDGIHSKFENLVNYERFKTREVGLGLNGMFENLVNYERFKTEILCAVCRHCLRTL